MLDIITCTESIDLEIIKSIIIKHLIQIDRSTGLSIEALKQEIRHYYRIESCVSSSSRFWIQRMRSIICILSLLNTYASVKNKRLEYEFRNFYLIGASGLVVGSVALQFNYFY